MTSGASHRRHFIVDPHCLCGSRARPRRGMGAVAKPSPGGRVHVASTALGAGHWHGSSSRWGFPSLENRLRHALWQGQPSGTLVGALEISPNRAVPQKARFGCVHHPVAVCSPGS